MEVFEALKFLGDLLTNRSESERTHETPVISPVYEVDAAVVFGNFLCAAQGIILVVVPVLLKTFFVVTSLIEISVGLLVELLLRLGYL